MSQLLARRIDIQLEIAPDNKSKIAILIDYPHNEVSGTNFSSAQDLAHVGAYAAGSHHHQRD
jgi:hypothetical protein